MSITNNLSTLQGVKNSIASAIESKGVAVAKSDPFNSYASKIESIQGGSSDTPTGGYEEQIQAIKDEYANVKDKDFTPEITYLHEFMQNDTHTGFKVAMYFPYISMLTYDRWYISRTDTRTFYDINGNEFDPTNRGVYPSSITKKINGNRYIYLMCVMNESATLADKLYAISQCYSDTLGILVSGDIELTKDSNKIDFPERATYIDFTSDSSISFNLEGQTGNLNFNVLTSYAPLEYMPTVINRIDYTLKNWTADHAVSIYMLSSSNNIEYVHIDKDLVLNYTLTIAGNAKNLKKMKFKGIEITYRGSINPNDSGHGNLKSDIDFTYAMLEIGSLKSCYNDSIGLLKTFRYIKLDKYIHDVPTRSDGYKRNTRAIDIGNSSSTCLIECPSITATYHTNTDAYSSDTIDCSFNPVAYFVVGNYSLSTENFSRHYIFDNSICKYFKGNISINANNPITNLPYADICVGNDRLLHVGNGTLTINATGYSVDTKNFYDSLSSASSLILTDCELKSPRLARLFKGLLSLTVTDRTDHRGVSGQDASDSKANNSVMSGIVTYKSESTSYSTRNSIQNLMNAYRAITGTMDIDITAFTGDASFTLCNITPCIDITGSLTIKCNKFHDFSLPKDHKVIENFRFDNVHISGAVTGESSLGFADFFNSANMTYPLDLSNITCEGNGRLAIIGNYCNGGSSNLIIGPKNTEFDLRYTSTSERSFVNLASNALPTTAGNVLILSSSINDALNFQRQDYTLANKPKIGYTLSDANATVTESGIATASGHGYLDTPCYMVSRPESFDVYIGGYTYHASSDNQAIVCTREANRGLEAYISPNKKITVKMRIGTLDSSMFESYEIDEQLVDGHTYDFWFKANEAGVMLEFEVRDLDGPEGSMKTVTYACNLGSSYVWTSPLRLLNNSYNDKACTSTVNLNKCYAVCNGQIVWAATDQAMEFAKTKSAYYTVQAEDTLAPAWYDILQSKGYTFEVV